MREWAMKEFGLAPDAAAPGGGRIVGDGVVSDGRRAVAGGVGRTLRLPACTSPQSLGERCLLGGNRVRSGCACNSSQRHRATVYGQRPVSPGAGRSTG